MVAMLGLPSWVPWWLPLLVLVPGVVWLLALLPMPFAVLGLRGRLEGIEARLDELQQEIRSLALRLPEPDPASHRIPVPPRREIFTPPYPDEDEPPPARRGADRGAPEPPRDRKPPDPSSRPRRLEPRLDFRR
jgi:hypothetical protein